jgi:GntR family transcriptional regulator
MTVSSWENLVAPSEPHYRRIMRDIRERIASGALKPGDKLPSTVELSEQYGVSAPTVRQAITILTETGELVGHQGLAVRVAERKP